MYIFPHHSFFLMSRYIDSDKKAKKFFKSDKLIEFVCERKEYDEDPKISFHGIDYRVFN